MIRTIGPPTKKTAALILQNRQGASRSDHGRSSIACRISGGRNDSRAASSGFEVSQSNNFRAYVKTFL